MEAGALPNKRRNLNQTEQIARGQRAKLLLEDETLREAFMDTEADLYAALLGAQSVEERETAHARLVGLYEVLKKLRVYMGQMTNPTLRRNQSDPSKE